MTRLFAGTPFDIPPRCERCGALEVDCKCEPLKQEAKANLLPPEQQTAKVRADQRKHKRVVTIVWALEPSANDFADLLTKLKSACGCGGSIQDDQIELQGDHVERVKEQLKKIGYKVR
jgi:translation initiation factor 1